VQERLPTLAPTHKLSLAGMPRLGQRFAMTPDGREVTAVRCQPSSLGAGKVPQRSRLVYWGLRLSDFGPQSAVCGGC
jgi:hypothetical protein